MQNLLFSCLLPSVKWLSNLEIISNSGSVKAHFKTTLDETPNMSVYTTPPQQTLVVHILKYSFNLIKLAPGVSLSVQLWVWSLQMFLSYLNDRNAHVYILADSVYLFLGTGMWEEG